MQKTQNKKVLKGIPRLDTTTNEMYIDQLYECVHCDFTTYYPEDIGYHCAYKHNIPLYDDEDTPILVD
jgi:hypothetical protein